MRLHLKTKMGTFSSKEIQIMGETTFGQTINLSSGTGNSFAAEIVAIPETTNVYICMG